MLNAVIFDLDETLIDSKEALLKYFRDMFEHIGLPFPEERREYLYTAPERGMLETLIEDPEKREEARAFRDSLSEEDQIGDFTLKPHALNAVRALHGRYKLAVATNRGPTTDKVIDLLGLKPYFEIVIGARTLPKAKPHPLVMETIFEALQTDAAHCILIGDSQVDVDSARAVGMRSVIVGRHAADGLGDYQLPDLSGVPELVDDISKGVR